MTEYPAVTIERELDASIERVYEAWTQPAKLLKWFHGSEAVRVESVDVDLREGGAYRITLRDPEDEMVVFGHYTRVDPPRSLEFTWQWAVSSLEKAETLVLVELESHGPRTLLRLTHSRLSSERSSQAHDAGWSGVLSSLASFVRLETNS